MATSNQYISVRETAQILGISEKKVVDLIDQKELQAYRIADQFLRLKKTEVLSLRSSGNVIVETPMQPYTMSEKIKDFFYFNDFYLVSLIVVFGLVLYIFFF